MSRGGVFDDVGGGDDIEVYGPDPDADYCLTLREGDFSSSMWVSRATLAEIHAFIGGLLADAS
jgi:hypothetical protein